MPYSIHSKTKQVVWPLSDEDRKKLGILRMNNPEASAKDIAKDLGLDLTGASQGGGSDGNFTGFLKDAIINPVTIEIDGLDWDNWSGDSYEVPEGKILYILQFYGEDSSALLIDGVTIVENYSNNIFYTGVGYTPAITFSMPVIVGAGQTISGGGHINGYLLNIN